MNKKQQVLSYINTVDCSTLRFEENPINEIDTVVLINLPLDNLVLACLDLTDRLPSYNRGKIETIPKKWRSVLDIWRHVRYFKPGVSIFETMEVLFRNKDLILQRVCPTINRRAFTLAKNHKGYWYMGDRDRDEFDLTFELWENINQEE